MNKITLPKKFEMTARNVPYFYDKNWLTNGHFMIKKDCLKNPVGYCVSDRAASNENLKRLVPSNAKKSWKKTDLIYEVGGEYRRVFECKETAETVCFNEKYIRHFKIEALLSEDGTVNCAFINLLGNFIIMPCRHNKTTFKYLG